MQELLKRLLEERARVWEQAKAILDTAENERRDMTGEEQEQWTRASADLDKLDERIAELTARIEREAEADAARERAERFVRPEHDRGGPLERSGDDELIAWFRSEQGPRGFEVPVAGIQVHRGASGVWEVRDLTAGNATAGGNTVPTGFRRQLYEHLIENSGIRQTRAEIITTASGEPLVLPKTTAHPAAGTLTAEAGLIADNDPSFGQGTLTAYKYTSLVQLSSELLQDTAVDLTGYLARAFGAALANGAGAHMITGDGSSKPHGVIAAAGTVALVKGGTTAGPGFTADALIDLFYTVKEPYAANGEWLMRRSTLGEVRKLKDNDGQYLWQPALTAGAPDLILGHPVRTDPNMPAAGTASTCIAFGDFSAFKIRDVGSIRFERSDDFAFANDLVTYRAILRTDSDLLDTTGAIGVIYGGTANP
ncbi:MAG: phage major capsid protein [Steroidobacteraceae bacterium]|nr:phage major capsid protein [Steroidobacteraceae bacterium]